MSKKATPKKAPKRRTSTTTPALPPIVSGLLALMDEGAGATDADEMGRALAAARIALRDPLRGRSVEVKDRMWGFVLGEAERGPWKALDAKIHTLTRPEDSDFNAINGDFQNLYGGPAFTMGIAVAYVFLQEGGAR